MCVCVLPVSTLLFLPCHVPYFPATQFSPHLSLSLLEQQTQTLLYFRILFLQSFLLPVIFLYFSPQCLVFFSPYLPVSPCPHTLTPFPSLPFPAPPRPNPLGLRVQEFPFVKTNKLVLSHLVTNNNLRYSPQPRYAYV